MFQNLDTHYIFDFQGVTTRSLHIVLLLPLTRARPMQDYPMLHAPWLLMQSCIISIELLVFFVRLFLEGLHVTRDEILISLLTLHNWLQVFCLFQRQTAQRRAL